jgi:hypothetical protein
VRRPAPQRVIQILVDVDDDWTSTVARMPMHRPAIGLSKTSDWRKVRPAVVPRVVDRSSCIISGETT